MKKKNTGKIIGIILIIVSLCIMGYVLKSYFDSQAKLNSLLKNTTSNEDESSDSNDIASALEVLTEDQKVAEVKDGVFAIQIPSLGIIAPISEGTDSKTLKYSAGHFTQSGEVGQLGNFAIAGHSSAIYNCIFNNLQNIKLCDEIDIFDGKGNKFVYYCVSKDIIAPDDWSVLNDFGDTRLTVLTCAESGKMRLSVVALMMTPEELENFRKEVTSDKASYMRGVVDSLSNITVSEFLDSRTLIEDMFYGFPKSAFPDHKLNYVFERGYFNEFKR